MSSSGAIIFFLHVGISVIFVITRLAINTGVGLATKLRERLLSSVVTLRTVARAPRGTERNIRPLTHSVSQSVKSVVLFSLCLTIYLATVLVCVCDCVLSVAC